MALTPSETVRAAWTTVADAALWAGVNPELWKRDAHELETTACGIGFADRGK